MSASPFVSCDVCVVGGGSAGLGAATASSRMGLSTILLEKGDQLGGTAVRGGVHNWEPGVGGTAFAQEIYRRLAAIPQAAGVWSMSRHWCWPHRNTPPFPGGEQLIDPKATYQDTLLRCGTRGLTPDAEKVRKQWHGVIFEPDHYACTVEEMLQESGHCQIWKKTSFISASVAHGRITEVRALRDGKEQAIRASFFIDATADALLGRSAGCEIMTGEEDRSAFNEPDAPLHSNSRRINAITLIYRVTSVSAPKVESLPADIPAKCWFHQSWCGASIGQYPCGDRNINMLPTMEGDEFLSYIDRSKDGYRLAYEECRRRIIGHWHFIQTEYPEFQSYRMNWIAPALGVRETRRIVGEYVLTQHDLLAGLSHQTHHDIIAIADHAFDTHGQGSRGCPELPQPYGVPLRCLIPKKQHNLLVAGRCASFSHIAASSSRLSRTMMDLGHAAGLAVFLAQRDHCDVREIDTDELRSHLLEQGATLSWASAAQPETDLVAAASH